MFAKKASMSQLIDEVVHELQKHGYVSEYVSCIPSFQTAIASLDKELLNALDVIPEPQQKDSSSYFLTLTLHHHPTNLDLSLDFCYRLPENAERLQCHRLSAMAGEVSRVYKINYDHPLPSLPEVAQTLQQKLKMPPFIRQLDTMLDNMKDRYYNRIKSAESNMSIVDAIRRKVQTYFDHRDIGRTRILKVSGKYHLLRDRMDTDIILELNKDKKICQIKQIENFHEHTKMIFLPGRKQHLDTPFEMLSLLSQKHEIEKKVQTAQRFKQLPPPAPERIGRRK
jgi:hypothetical protein